SSFEDGALARSFAARTGGVSEDECRVALAVARAERSVFRIDRVDARLVGTSLFGARYRIVETGAAARLQGGERLDGRIVSIAGSLELMPGAVYHPAE